MRPEFVKDGNVEFFSCIHDRSTVAISGFNLATTPEDLILDLFDNYIKTGHPNKILVETDALPAAPGRALDIVFKKMFELNDYNFIRGMLVPFMGFSPYLQKLALNDAFPVYGWPIGVSAYWFREVASGRPGVLTRIGLDTFLDPEYDGGALNESAKREKLCKIAKIDLSGEDYLIYRAPKPEFAMIRATSSDKKGNLTMEDEPIRGTVLSIAQATRARPNPGKVFAQVLRNDSTESYNPRRVEVPYPLVDYIIKSPLEHHWQASSFAYDPMASFSKELSSPETINEKFNPPAKSDAHLLIARRTLIEINNMLRKIGPPLLINLGVGIPALVSGLILKEGLSSDIVTVVESGPWGGLALTGANFGVSMGAFALSTIPDMFSNYEGGIIDTAALGFLQVDKYGNVNPSFVGSMLTGPGGFPVIAEGTPSVIFAGTFQAGNVDFSFDGNKMTLKSTGGDKKFVKNVYKVFFSGKQAVKYHKTVKIITERCVFSLTERGIVLEEVAPGLDLDRDIIENMEFKPVVPENLTETPPIAFGNGNMGLKKNSLQ
ncbi:MAG: CoA-transferase [Thermoplasmataceae archaeon]|jgi:acyl CoA:acetate/3-ketoacid CoA transferase